MAPPFRQDRHFFYMSGVNEPDCYLTYHTEKEELTLWLPKQRTPREILYVGPVLTPEVALKNYDIDMVSLADSLQDYILDYLKDPKAILFVMNQRYVEDFANLEINLNKSGEPGSVNHKLLMPTIDACRVIKSDQEIEYIKKANKITALAHTEVLKNLKNMDNETVAEGVYIGTTIAAGAKTQAYEPIVASGSNASTLHYTKNDEDFGNRQMLLIDAGCEWNCYACDVTRTFPISGDYPSPEAQAIYELVEKMQEECIARMIPGVLFRDVNLFSHFVAAEGLLKLGILRNGTADELIKNRMTSAFYPHGLGHHVGLEVHDVDDSTQPVYPTIHRPFGLSQSSIEPVVDHSKPFANDIWVDPEIEYNQFQDAYGHLFDPSTHFAPARISKTDGGGMRPGMVITVEPGLYFNEFGLQFYLKDPKLSKYINTEVLKQYMPVGGVRIEDDILVTEAKPINLTVTPKGDEAIKIIQKGPTYIQDHSCLFAKEVAGIPWTDRFTTIARIKQ